MSGSLVSLTPDQQIEVIYIAYFGRAADSSGQTYWSNAYKTMTTPVSEGGYGFTSIGAIVNIANNFALGPEAMALYSFLANPPTIPISNASTPPTDAQRSVNTFLTAVYQDLFNRAPDSGGEAYWSTQILTGAISVGAAIFDIANGAAVGSIDASVLANKLEAATYFTTQTAAIRWPYPSSLIPAAHTAVVDVVDPATEADSQATTDRYVFTGGLQPKPVVPVLGSDLPTGSIASGGADATQPPASLTSLYSANSHIGV